MMPSTLRSWRQHGWAVVAATDVGKVRARQEDAWSVLFSARYAGQTVDAFAVFDGLGGEPRGQEAARAANEGLEAELMLARNADDVLPALERRVDASGGMTTAAIVFVPRARPGNGWALTAGDSAVYGVADGGRLALTYPKDRAGGAITSCLGGGLLTAHSTILQFSKGQTFVLCTDGVDEVVGVGALGALARASPEGLEGAVRDVFARIDAAGAPDNATLVAARWLGT